MVAIIHGIGVDSLFRIGIFGIFLLLMLEAWLVDGGNVVSSSMAPTIHGPHYDLTCPDCQHPFIVNQADEISRQATCPHCGYAEVPVAEDALKSGDRVFCFKGSPSGYQPKRFEMILFRDPENPTKRVVKRVIGLPGEKVAISEGGIFINDKRFVKPFRLQQQMRLPVDFGVWKNENCSQYFLTQRPIPHFRPMFSSENGAPESTFQGITNENPENQLFPHDSRNTHQTNQLMLEFDWEFSENSPVEIAVFESFKVRLDSHEKAKQLEIFRKTDQLFSCQYKNPGRSSSSNHWKITISTFDRQLLVVANGKALYCESFEQLDGDIPFRIRGSGVIHPTVYRDVYYTDQPDKSDAAVARESWTVPRDSLFVLGDNSRFSDDSRIWKNSFLSMNHVIGPIKIIQKK